MPLASHVAALLEALRASDFEMLPPVERERFAYQCERIAALARKPHEDPQKGILYESRDGRSSN
jgi:hypothetical protein